MSEMDCNHLDISSDELNRFSKAFKSEEFHKLFADYCNEITDPVNQRAFEAELKQLEAERGIDIAFIKPEPGFVIKTNLNGNQKVFINVAKNEQIEKPSSECAQDRITFMRGLNWRLPYVQSKPKRDFDNNKAACPVYDVVFHPDTLHLTEKNGMFKKLVVKTACDAVQSTFNVRLDLNNLKFPKLGYKGIAQPTIIHRKNGESVSTEPSKIDHILPVKSSDAKVKQSNVTQYATPKYEIVHRREIELHELDSKINVTLPKELLVKIDLPLLNSSKDVFLEVNTKSILLLSEVPAKYKLNITLPFEVNKLCGKAQFDSDTRKLVITLPVVRRKELGTADLCREDSGIESDHHSPKEDSSSGSGDDVFEDALDTIPKNSSKSKGEQKTSNKKSKYCCDVAKQETSSYETDPVSTFLNPNISYTLPQFTYNRFQNIIAFTLHVKNVEPDSIVMQNDNSSFELKFTSVGTDHLPVHYSFYFANSSTIIKNKPRTEIWDNNVIIHIDLDSVDSFKFYQAGLSKNDCKEFTCSHLDLNEQKSLNNTGELLNGSEDDQFKIETAVTSDEVKIEIIGKNCDEKRDSNAQSILAKGKKSKKANKKNRSFSESHCDDLIAEQAELKTQIQVISSNACPQHLSKSRTQSESSNDDHHAESFPLKSILKRHSSYDRQTSECSIDEHGYSCSVDLGIGSFTSIPEETDHELSESVRKTVRFDKQLCRKLLFKMNSTIVGQRKPKENKRKKKKRNRERCYSEGEASDYENHPPSNVQQNACNGNCHQKTGSDSNRKNGAGKEKSKSADKSQTESKNNLMFDIEI